ncbi:MAG: DUF4345 domain-containing protein [Halieaceae bacterium]|jgi:hypothetical protein|uniref:DUF4345 domain-containing protein n=1 Tax=Haliea alexandrii TaxID=2448162 RepID=UPI000F0B59FC|nr:DUF4345 domain-containing protein [Haliea alexandrii]MCR9183998.1 DUF4345 domain-containing protein [Halieaceae bacterium]
MKKTIFRVYFVIAGLLLFAIGTAILFAPTAFHAANGVALGSHPNLLSEIRAPGALLAGSGILVLMGAFRQARRAQAAQLSLLVFGTFGVARLVSIVLDGIPSASLLGATVLELSMASVGLLILLQRRSQVSRPMRVSGRGVIV